MAYVFKQKESVAHNINRILTEEVRAALDALANSNQITGETIHGVRKRIKKIRALFRLIQSEQKEKDFQRENRFYRTIGHQLSSLRDATVMIKTLDQLQAAQPAVLSAQTFTTLRTTLIDQQERTARAFFENPAKFGQVTNALEQASPRVAGLSKRHNGFSIMAPNLKATYRRARKALKSAIHKPSVDHLHELRKDVKTLWYHTRLLQPVWPGLFKAYEHEFGRLGELLGDDHDYGVLAQAIESDQLLLGNQQAKEAILQGLHQQRSQLQEQIYPLANRLLAEKAGEFVNRFRLSWKVWRAEASGQAKDLL